MREITEKQAVAIDSIINLVKENESILVQMRVRVSFIRRRDVAAYYLTNMLSYNSLVRLVPNRKT